MTREEALTFGRWLRSMRKRAGLETVRLAALSDVDASTIVRLEAGAFKNPKAQTLSRIAQTLQLEVSDMLQRAGIPVIAPPIDVPVYLRQGRYNRLPPEAKAELDHYLEFLAQRYGLDATGPADGEDES